MEVPLRAGERPFVDREAHELDAEATTTVFLEDIDVREVRLHVTVGDRPGKANLRGVPVQPDDACGGVDQRVLDLARTTLGPVRPRQVPVHRRAVDPTGIVVELVAVAEVALHTASVRS